LREYCNNAMDANTTKMDLNDVNKHKKEKR